MDPIEDPVPIAPQIIECGTSLHKGKRWRCLSGDAFIIGVQICVSSIKVTGPFGKLPWSRRFINNV